MLAVDIGNTFTRIAAFSGGTIRGRRSFLTRDLDVVDLMAGFGELHALADVDAVWIASVVPDANAVVDSAAERAGLGRRFIRPGIDPIIRHRLGTPQTTGVDRLLSAAAAGALHFSGAGGRRGYVIVQCGSAATVDLVDGEGVFRGGYILPGPSLWLSGLSGAAQLPDFSNEPPDWDAVLPGNNTRDAILHGMAAALPLAVAAAAMCISAGLGTPDGDRGGLPTAVTGGWGEAAARSMGGERVYDKDLLLQGIRLFAERNP